MKRLTLVITGFSVCRCTFAQGMGSGELPGITPEVVVAAFSAIFAGIAVLVAVAGFMRGRAGAQSELFLTLRTRFIDIHGQLPEKYADQNWSPESEVEYAATLRYWHHAFDEWFITTQLNSYANILWTQYFWRAHLSALKHPGLRAVVINITRKNMEITADWKNYRVELDRIWARTHTNKTTKCLGIECPHHTSDGG